MTSVLTQPRAGLGSLSLHFVEPLPGFDGETEYTLREVDPQGVLYTMRSVQDPALRFVLTPATVFFTDYRPELSRAVRQVLQVDAEEQLRVLLVLTIGTELSGATANLRAPIVVVPETGAALQLVLDDEALPMHQPLLGG